MSTQKRALNVLPYRGIGKPAGYSCYHLPYPNRSLASGSAPQDPAGAPSKFKLEVLSVTLADFDGKAIIVNLLTLSGISTKTLTFDDDTAPPSTASSINIMGLTTVAQIAAQIQLAFELAGFRSYIGFNNTVWVYQSLGGTDGNQTIEFTGDLSGEIEINGISDFIGFNVFMYGGTSINVPVLWGPRRGLSQSTPNNVQFATTPV